MAKARSGAITVTTAGTAVQGPSYPKAGNDKLVAFYIKADADNTDTVYVGNDGSGDVSATNGFPLNSGESIVIEANSLDDLWFDADVNGEKIRWIQVSS
jgi:hypothetical protein